MGSNGTSDSHLDDCDTSPDSFIYINILHYSTDLFLGDDGRKLPALRPETLVDGNSTISISKSSSRIAVNDDITPFLSPKFGNFVDSSSELYFDAQMKDLYFNSSPILVVIRETTIKRKVKSNVSYDYDLR